MQMFPADSLGKMRDSEESLSGEHIVPRVCEIAKLSRDDKCQFWDPLFTAYLAPLRLCGSDQSECTDFHARAKKILKFTVSRETGCDEDDRFPL